MSDLANGGLIVIGVALAVVAAVAMALRRRQERSILEDWARRQGWKLSLEAEKDLQARLQNSVLMQIGHSRRFSSVAEDTQGVRAFEFACETGFEHERESHRWIGVVIMEMHRRTRAIISDESWVLSTAANPAFGILKLGEVKTPDGKTARRIAIVEDMEAWQSDLHGEFGKRITSGPAGRTWEIADGMVMVFQAVPMSEEEVESLLSAGKEIAKLVRDSGSII